LAYNRTAAVNYARFFSNRVCHDARVALKTGYPSVISGVNLTPGLPLTQVGIPRSEEEDCTHFISCCVGQALPLMALPGALSPLRIPVPFGPQSGGLAISSPFSALGVYGQTWTPALVDELKKLGAKVVGKDFEAYHRESLPLAAWTLIDAAIKKLEPGDVLAYASKDNALKYEHICLIVAKNGKIACHTHSRFGEDYTDVNFAWVTLLKMP
jgi:hypothetical protein